MEINTGKYKDVISNVLIDDRENKRIEYALKQYKDFNPLKSHLDVGDYIFVGNNGRKVVFEYKTGSDFLNSINDENHHLHNQVYDMVTNFDYTFVMVECADLMQQADELYYSTGISMSLPQINGAISEFSTVSTVLQAQTQYQAFDLMMRTSAKIIQDKPYSYKYGKKTTNSALNYLGAIKGVDNYAEIICRKLDLHTHKDLMKLTLADLTSIKGIGEKKAEKIIKQLR